MFPILWVWELLLDKTRFSGSLKIFKPVKVFLPSGTGDLQSLGAFVRGEPDQTPASTGIARTPHQNTWQEEGLEIDWPLVACFSSLGRSDCRRHSYPGGREQRERSPCGPETFRI